MSGRHVVLKANDLLLLIVHKPPLATRLDGIVFMLRIFLKHIDNTKETTLSSAGEVAVSDFLTVSVGSNASGDRTNLSGQKLEASSC